jgi:hypothetical protein
VIPHQCAQPDLPGAQQAEQQQHHGCRSSGDSLPSVLLATVLVTRRVCADGRRLLLDMRMAGEESAAAWREVVECLVARHVGVSVLAVVDGGGHSCH